MEMISPNWEALLLFVATAAFVYMVVKVGQSWVIDRKMRKAETITLEPKNLADPEVRDRMQRFLALHCIVGSADIRDGKVDVPPADVDWHPVMLSLRHTVDSLSRLENPNACSLYVRDAKFDRWNLLPMDLMDLKEILRLFSAVAGENR